MLMRPSQASPSKLARSKSQTNSHFFQPHPTRETSAPILLRSVSCPPKADRHRLEYSLSAPRLFRRGCRNSSHDSAQSLLAGTKLPRVEPIRQSAQDQWWQYPEKFAVDEVSNQRSHHHDH